MSMRKKASISSHVLSNGSLPFMEEPNALEKNGREKQGAPTVAEQRKYTVLNVNTAKQVAFVWLQAAELANAIEFGLPEVDDRYHVWRVPLLRKTTRDRIGEVVIDAYTSLILENKTTAPHLLESRLLGRDDTTITKPKDTRNGKYKLSAMRNTIALGDSEKILPELPAESVDLVFTSPPYFNLIWNKQ